MKIVMLSSGTIHGTLTYRILSFARELVVLGHEVTIITPSFDKYSNYKKERINSIDGIRIIQPFQFNTKLRWLNLSPYIFHSTMILLSLQIDIIHLYKPTPVSIIGIISKLWKKTPVIVDMDDLGSKVMEQENNNYLTVKLVYLCEIISLKFATGIICASSYLKKMYSAKYPNKPVVWISNGIDSRFIKAAKTEHGISKRIVVIGSLNRSNILEPLIMALSQVVEKLRPHAVEVLIIGDGYALSHIKNLAVKNGVEKYIKYLGWVLMDDIPQHLKAGDIGYAYMPNDESIQASSNLKLFQYMATGVVPVVSDVGDLPYYVDNGVSGYIARKDDILDLTSTIINALQDDELRFQKVKHAQKFVKDNFTWSILTMKVEKFYKSFI